MPPKNKVPTHTDFKHEVLAQLKLVRREIAALAADVARILELVTPLRATTFSMSAYTEPMDFAATSGKELVMPPTPFPGPVPPGHRVIVTVTSKDDSGATAAIDGDFQATRDDDGAMTVTELTTKKVWDVACDPPADVTHDTTVSVMDSDNTPADSFTIDWDGPVVVPSATGFGFTVRTEPIV